MTFCKKMKTLLFCATLFVCSVLGANAEESPALPDFTKSFPTEKLFMRSKPGDIESYWYATDLDFSNIKKNFSKFLGEDWQVTEMNPEEKKGIETSKEKGIDVVGTCIFISPKHNQTRIVLSQMLMAFYGKKFSVTVSPMTKKAEQDGDDQPAAALDSKAK